MNVQDCLQRITKPFQFDTVEDKMCLGYERKEIRPSTSNKEDSQADGEDNVTDATLNNS